VKRLWTVLMAALLVGSASVVRADGLGVELVASGLDRITSIVSPRDGTDRLFLTLQDGRIVIWTPTGGVRPNLFLDMRHIVSKGTEQGLLGLAFHPDYKRNGFFFLHYTAADGAVTVGRFRVSADPSRADPASHTVILSIAHSQFDNHNGGQLHFGPDGYLYVAVGDGGGGWDVHDNAQNLGTLLGKILRLDVDHGATYVVPPTNPFVSRPGARPEIWAYGLRNPWRFSFDSATGDLWIGDVGEQGIEEIDYQPGGRPGGQNYGWRPMEGMGCLEGDGPARDRRCASPGMTLPVLEYQHWRDPVFRCAVTGGYRYRGPLPGLLGLYLFGDYCSGTVFGAQPDAQGVWRSAPLFESNLNLSTFGEDAVGRIYLADSRAAGSLYKLVSGASALTAGDAGRVLEGQRAVFPVLLTPASTQTVTVGYDTVDGTARSGTDYTATSGTLTFAPGQTVATVSVPLLNNDVHEVFGNKGFRMQLHGATGASIRTSAEYGVAAIVDDDPFVDAFSFGADEKPGGSSARVDVTVRWPVLPVPPLLFDYATVDRTATAGADYVARTGALAIPFSEEHTSLSVPILDDVLVEAPETFDVVLTNRDGRSSSPTATVTITSDDVGPDVSANDVTVSEADSGMQTATFQVALSAPSTQTVTVRYETNSVTANSGADFVYTTGTLTFAPGVTSGIVSVTVLDDRLNEAEETFRLALSAVNAHVTRAGTATIVDDDPPPTLSIVAGPPVVEGTGRAQFEVKLSEPSGRQLTVPFAISGTASGGPDPRSGFGTMFPIRYGLPALTMNVGESGPARKIRVQLQIEGMTPERLASLDILLVSPRGQAVLLMSDVAAQFPNARMNLVFDDSAPPMTSGPMVSGSYRPTDIDPPGDRDGFALAAPPGPYATSLSVFDGVDPTGTWTLYVANDSVDGSGSFPNSYLSGAVLPETRADYVWPAWSSLAISPGTTTASLNLNVLADGEVEPEETIAVDISAPAFVTLLEGHAATTIIDDDHPALSIQDLRVAPGTDPTEASLAVRLDQPPLEPVTVTYATADETAVAGTDYEAATGTLTFPAGTVVQPVPVTIAPGAAAPDRTFVVDLADPSGATIRSGRGRATIGAPLPLVSIDDVAVSEGGPGLTEARFTVTLSAPSERTVLVPFATAEGTARSTSSSPDFVAVAGTLTFTPGTTVQEIAVPIYGDDVYDPDETFALNLSNATGAMFARERAIGTILTDEAPYLLRLNTFDQYESTGSPREFFFGVTVDPPSSAPISVRYRTVDGSATAADGDYQPVDGILSFPPFSTFQRVPVFVTGDDRFEPEETFSLQLESPVGATVVPPGLATVRIYNDDPEPWRLSVAGEGAVEGSKRKPGKARFTVTLSPPPFGGVQKTVTVRYATVPGTAADGADYRGRRQKVTFKPGSRRVRTIEIPFVGDLKPEADETFRILLSDPTNADIAVGEATVTILDDDRP
jgi:hypothetical protein